MRLFFALDPNNAVRAALCAVQQRMAAQKIDCALVPAGNFHVTLRFLGETNDLGGISKALCECVRGIRPFELRLSGLSAFGAGPKKTVVALLSGNTAEAKALFESAEAALGRVGFLREKRPLVPHITLARRAVLPADALEALASHLQPAGFTAEHLTLYESVKGRSGQMIYRPLQKERF